MTGCPRLQFLYLWIRLQATWPLVPSKVRGVCADAVLLHTADPLGSGDFPLCHNSVAMINLLFGNIPSVRFL